MKTRLAGCFLFILLFISASCLAQTGILPDPQETLSTFAGARLYSRTLETEDESETAQQFVVPLFLRGSITEDLSIRIYQTVSSSQLEDGPSLSGLESTRIQASFSLPGDSVMAYLGASLPIVGTDPEIETAHLSNLLYSDALGFGVSKLTEGLDLDAGFAFAQAFGDFSLGFGAGYIFRGKYDTLLYGEELVDYNPGDAINASAGFHFGSAVASLRGRGVYVHYMDDAVEEDETFKSGDEISFLASAAFDLDPLGVMIFVADTMKADSDALQEGLTISNLFRNRLNGGVSLAFELLDEILILKAQASGKVFLDEDSDVDAQVAYMGGGFQIVPINDLTVDILGSLILGNMDAGDTDISGFNLGLIINYGF